MLICETTLPLDKVVGCAGAILEWAIACTHDSLNSTTLLEIFLDALLFELIRLDFFGRDLSCSTSGLESRVASPDVLDIVVDTLESFVSLEELVRLLCVVEMGESLPLDVKALQGREQWQANKEGEHTMLEVGLSSGSSSGGRSAHVQT
jgi:hypothetical protein